MVTGDLRRTVDKDASKGLTSNAMRGREKNKWRQKKRRGVGRKQFISPVGDSRRGRSQGSGRAHASWSSIPEERRWHRVAETLGEDRGFLTWGVERGGTVEQAV